MRSLFNKVAGLQAWNFFKKRLQHRCFSWIIEQLFFRTPLLELLLAVLLQYSKFRWGVCSLISHLHVLSILIKNLHKNFAQIILYYHLTKQFLSCLNLLITCLRFHNMNLKNICCFLKNLHKALHINYVILIVKGLSSPALCVWSSAFNFRIWFGKRKNAV